MTKAQVRALFVVLLIGCTRGCTTVGESGPCDDGERRCEGERVTTCVDGEWSEPWSCLPLDGGLADIPTTCQSGDCRP